MDCKIIITLKQNKCTEQNYSKSSLKSKDKEKNSIKQPKEGELILKESTVRLTTNLFF